MDTLYRFSSETLLKPLTSIITQNGMPMRKAFISLCIYQGLPSDPNSALYEKTIEYITLVLPMIHQLQESSVVPSNDNPWVYLDSKLSSPYFSGLLLYALHIHPYTSREEEQKIYYTQRIKEVEVLDSRQPYSRLIRDARNGRETSIFRWIHRAPWRTGFRCGC